MARGKQLSDAQRDMIVSAYKYFLNLRKEGSEATGRTRRMVHECIGTPEATIARVWKAYQSGEGVQTLEERRARPQL
ncbi:hypothetical protein DVH05_000374 [Phytophthora capsici]|nr:hypothetical protein DVH05_026139 [Phytophthora capsici]KAG1712632.1 hypothetical protein DVH05_000374 [Phytophthora capsici]